MSTAVQPEIQTPFPVDNLHHIAYHPVWSDEFDGQLASRIREPFIFLDEADGVHIRRLDSGDLAAFLKGHSMPEYGSAGLTISPQNRLTFLPSGAQQQWSVPLEFTTPVRWAYVAQTHAFVADDSGLVQCHHLTDGSLHWDYQVFRGPPSLPFFTRGHVWIAGDDYFVHQIERDTGLPVGHHKTSFNHSLLQVSTADYYVIAEACDGSSQGLIRCFLGGYTSDWWQISVAGRVTAMVATETQMLHCLLDTASGLRLTTISLADGVVIRDRTYTFRLDTLDFSGWPSYSLRFGWHLIAMDPESAHDLAPPTRRP